MPVKTVTDTFSLTKAKRALNLALPELVNDAVDIVKADISAGIEYGRDIHGRPFTKLQPATIRAKRAKGSEFPRRILYDRGIMQNTYVVQRATLSKPTALLRVPKSRQDIGGYHHRGEGNLPVRQSFGISRTAHEKIDRQIRYVLLRVIGKGWGGRG